jgi:hypothetical protein
LQAFTKCCGQECGAVQTVHDYDPYIHNANANVQLRLTGSWRELIRGRQGRWQMGTILIIVLVVLLFGGGGGYYGYSRYGGPGVGGALGLVLVVFLVVWFFGGLHISR